MRDADRTAGCICSSRLHTSEMALLGPHMTRMTGCGKELLAMPKMGSGDPLTDYCLPGSHRLEVDLKGNKWKCAANLCTLNAGKARWTMGCSCVASTMGRTAIFRKPRKRKSWEKGISKPWSESKPCHLRTTIPEQWSQFTNPSILFALVSSSHSCPSSCFAKVEARGRKPLFPSSDHLAMLTLWTWRTMQSGDHTTSQSTWTKGLSLTSQTLCCLPPT